MTDPAQPTLASAKQPRAVCCQRHQHHQRRPGIDPLADLHVAVGHHAAYRRADHGAFQVEPG